MVFAKSLKFGFPGSTKYHFPKKVDFLKYIQAHSIFRDKKKKKKKNAIFLSLFLLGG